MKLVDPPVLDEDGIKALKSIKLIGGPGESEELAHRTMCIMQAHAYITGQVDRREEPDGYVKLNVTWKPMCSSGVVTEMMVAINDDHPKAQTKYGHALLKKAIPYNMGTAPVEEATIKIKGKPKLVQRKAERHPDYIKVEELRKARRDEIVEEIAKANPMDDIDSWEEAVASIPLAKALAYVREISDMGRFNAGGLVPQKEESA